MGSIDGVYLEYNAGENNDVYNEMPLSAWTVQKEPKQGLYIDLGKIGVCIPLEAIKETLKQHGYKIK